MELIIKVLYKEEEEGNRGIIPFCLISSSLFVASTTINKKLKKIFLNNLILLDLTYNRNYGWGGINPI